jgi:hypothetical protein
MWQSRKAHDGAAIETNNNRLISQPSIMGFVQYAKRQKLPLIEETICTISLQQLKKSEQLHFGSKIAANVGNIHIKQILHSENSLEAMEEYNMFCIIFGDVEFSSPHSRTQTPPMRYRRKPPARSSPIAPRPSRYGPKRIKTPPPVVASTNTTPSNSGTSTSSSSSGVLRR